MYYRHNLGYEYPERCDQHMIVTKNPKNISFDENYNYLPKGFFPWVKRASFWCAMNFLVFPICTFAFGVRIKGRKNIKKNKELLKNGAITISNHVFKWDYICVLKAIRPHLVNFPAWKDNFLGSEAWMVKWAGGIPIPTDNIKAMRKFKTAMEDVFNTKKWMHFYPEGSMWLFYPDIRPLKNAVFKFAVKYDRPIIPITMSFRKRKGITRLFTKWPMVDVHIGEPLVPNKDAPKNEEAERLHKEAYHVMQVMNDITPDMPNYNVDQNPDNYQKTM